MGLLPAPETWVDSVLAYWFAELAPSSWFVTDAAIDAAIRTRFLAVHTTIAADLDLDATTASAQRALAGIIVLDQFPRNMFRGTARAFATDHVALAIAKAAVGKRLDTGLTKTERLFFYLPFEHSEVLGDQQIAVQQIAGLNDAELLRFATAHRDIIARFGRFPHRNAMLGRPSTVAEDEFLKLPGSSF